MAATIKVYGNNMSPPCRAVYLVAKALQVPLELVYVIGIGEFIRSQEFLQMNPTHTIPTIDDNGFFLWDSHAIAGYLVNTYGPDSGLYPSSPKKKVIVDMMMHFDNSRLFPRFIAIFVAIYLKKAKRCPPDVVEVIHEDYNLLETFLKAGPWLAGKTVTIADLCCVATTSFLVEMVPAAVNKYPKLNEWLDSCRSLPYYDANQEGVNATTSLLKAKLVENNKKA